METMSSKLDHYMTTYLGSIFFMLTMLYIKLQVENDKEGGSAEASMITVDSDDESPDKEEQLGKGKNLVWL